jgi:hypothetical protein
MIASPICFRSAHAELNVPKDLRERLRKADEWHAKWIGMNDHLRGLGKRGVSYSTMRARCAATDSAHRAG